VNQRLSDVPNALTVPPPPEVASYVHFSISQSPFDIYKARLKKLCSSFAAYGDNNRARLINGVSRLAEGSAKDSTQDPTGDGFVGPRSLEIGSMLYALPLHAQRAVN